MRSKFIVRIRRHGEKYPTKEELRSVIRRHGWESADVSCLASDEEKEEKYKQEGERLFEQMPEVVQNERNHVIFYGCVQSDAAEFVVTRSTEGEITYRLLQPELNRLIRATEKIIKEVEKDRHHIEFFSSSDEHIVGKQVLIYERDSDHVVLEGRVVENPTAETIKTNPKDTVVLILAAVFLVLRFASHRIFEIKFMSQEDFDKFTLSIVAVSLVSFIGFLITLFSIRKNRIISWDLKRKDC